MIVAWMLSATIFTLLLGAAAYAIERALRTTNFATRTPWVISLCIALVWPVLAPFALTAMNRNAPTIVAGASAASPSAMLAQQLPDIPVNWSERAGTTLLAAWALISALLIVRLAFAVVALRRVQSNARPTILDGQSVLVTESLGPAVIGLVNPRVAVPAWFLQLDAPLRALVLRHEREHCRSRDPQLVWLASIAVALMPWNAGLWWLSRRLRLALEIDCDTRTLRRESNHEQYGKLLLLIAQRQSGYPLATMLAESTSHLSRRITAMQMIRRVSAVRVVLLGGVAVAAIAVACSPRIATDLTGPQARATPALTKSASKDPVYFEFQVEKPVVSAKGSVGPKYPADLKAKAVEGAVLAQFVVDTLGMAEVGTFKVIKDNAATPQFADAIREALPSMRFQPAQVGGKPVKQLVQQPFQFSLGNSVAALNKLTPANNFATLSDFKGTKDNRVLQLPANVVTGSKSDDQRPKLVESKTQPEGRVTQASTYFEFQVNKPATPKAGSSAPVYPADLKAQKIEGEVLAQVIVGRDGLPEIASLKILRSTNPEFTQAVKDALGNMVFDPAMVNGTTVKQLVQLPFQFAVPK